MARTTNKGPVNARPTDYRYPPSGKFTSPDVAHPSAPADKALAHNSKRGAYRVKARMALEDIGPLAAHVVKLNDAEQAALASVRATNRAAQAQTTQGLNQRPKLK